MEVCRILVVRLGAMGDIIHALPAAASLKTSIPHCHLAWVVERKWVCLLEGNPFLDDVIPLERRKLGELLEARRRLRAGHFTIAVDFQGLIKSAVIASAAGPDQIFGFHRSALREPLAGLFYSHHTLPSAKHVVGRNLELAAAAGASSIVHAFPLPPGTPEGELPQGPFVLATPLAGWIAKQWPLENYAAVARRLRAELGLPLVLNGPPEAAPLIGSVPGVATHTSSVAGLIYATRKATAVVGIDSGPLHLAAALEKPGVAIYGPTDPERNGPYGGTITVLRSPQAITTYKRRAEVDGSMRNVSPEAVFEALKSRIVANCNSAGRSA